MSGVSKTALFAKSMLSTGWNDAFNFLLPKLLLESTRNSSSKDRSAGVEGTLSQGVNAFGLRRSRYRSFLAKTHLQQVLSSVAIPPFPLCFLSPSKP